MDSRKLQVTSYKSENSKPFQVASYKLQAENQDSRWQKFCPSVVGLIKKSNFWVLVLLLV
ncbi:MAG: hypothetical protein H0X30_20970, partial [Anaerolineae bacterium]|nr:hypothetical protein [Anaerolineae bacterium]